MFIADGSLIDEKFQVLGTIGRGGMGIVYEANQLGLDRIVALKVLSGVPEESQDEVVRFGREALILSRLSHINIVQFYAFGTWSGLPYIAMERLVGESLQNRLIGNQPLPIADTIEFIGQICNGLEHAHAHSVFHRDIKPTNIIVSSAPDGRSIVKIIDFGLAKLTGAGIQQLTQTNTAVGSVLYMSPEQCTGKTVDHRSDIYSTGCLLYHCLTGEPPFDADNAVAVMFQQVNESPVHRPGWQRLPEPLKEVVARCLAKEPAERFQSAGDLQDSLLQAAKAAVVAQAASASKSTVASPLSTASLSTRAPKISRKKLLTVTVLPAIFILCALVMWYSIAKAPVQRAPDSAAGSLSSSNEIMTSLIHRTERSLSSGALVKRITQAELKQLAQAVEQYRHEPAFDTDTLLAAYNLLAIQYSALGETEKLRNLFSQALGDSAQARKPGPYFDMLHGYHLLLAESGAELSLLHELETARQRFPRMNIDQQCGIQLFLGKDYAKLGRDAEARSLLERVRVTAKQSYQRAAAVQSLKKLDEKAKKTKEMELLTRQLDKEIRTKKDACSTICSLARLYEQTERDPTELLLHHLENPAISPVERLVLRRELGLAYLHRGDRAKCEQIWTEILAPMRTVTLSCNSPMVMGYYYLVVSGLARIYLETGRYKDCIAITEKWSNDDSGRNCPPFFADSLMVLCAHAYRHLGVLDVAEKLYRQAMPGFESALKKRQDDGQSLEYRAETNCGLACVLFLRGNYKDSAKPAFDAITDMGPTRVNDIPRRLCYTIVGGACLEKLEHRPVGALIRPLAIKEIPRYGLSRISPMSYLFDDLVPVASLTVK